MPSNYFKKTAADPNHHSILRQQTFNPMSQQQQQSVNKAAPISTAKLVQSVQNDMLNAEKGGQWLFSSYAPFKDKAAFPGFEDQSFEEIRLGFYEAKKHGMLEQYVSGNGSLREKLYQISYLFFRIVKSKLHPRK